MTNPLTHRPLEALPEIIEDKITRKFDNVKSVYLRKLYNKVGDYTKVGEMIGYTGTSIGNMLSQDTVRKSAELAARWVYETEYAEAKKPSAAVTAVIQGDLSHLKTIKDLLTSLGGKFSYVGEL